MQRPDDDEADTAEKTFAIGGFKGPGQNPGLASTPAPVDPAAGSLGAPSSLERYHLRRRIGQGAMGEVHLCKDNRIGRDVAMKIILPNKQADAQARARFVREARVQGQLEHPAIVPVYDLGIDALGSIFFTMKCLRGLTLAQIIRAQKNGDREVIQAYPRRRLLGAFAAACLAVHFAHSRGVLHRDLKPANIMLGDFGEVYVLDWGIAKLREPEQEDAARVEDPLQEDIHTAADSILGTFGYMSPEQALGKAAALDERSDVYALGAILFELLTLQSLHPRDTWNAMLRSTLTGAVVKVSERAPDRDVPPELEAICVKATKLHPDERFATVRELHDAVESFLNGDRDVIVRGDMASRYARAAEEAAAKGVAGGPGSEAARREALREVARALALDPTNADAMRVLGRIVTTPPVELPAEVLDEMVQADASRRRFQLKEAVRANLFGVAILVPFTLWMGIQSVPLFVTALATIGAAIGAQLLAIRTETKRPAHGYAYAAFMFNIISLLCVSRAFGPLVMMPMILAVLTFSYSMATKPAYRRVVIATAGCALIGSVVLEQMGVIDRSYAFSENAMTILPNAVMLPQTPTLIALTVVSFFFAISPSVIMGRLQADLRAAEQRSFLQVWHLRQLLPGPGPSPVPAPAPRQDPAP